MVTSTLMNPRFRQESKPSQKRQPDFKFDYMKSLMIKLHRTGPRRGFNEDEGRRVKTKQWDPLLIKLRKKMGLDQAESNT